jgi:hypothetical protein
MIDIASYKKLKEQCDHYIEQSKQLYANDYGCHTRLAKKWHKIVLNKIRILSNINNVMIITVNQGDK